MIVLRLILIHLLWNMSRMINLGSCTPSFVKSIDIQSLLCTSVANINLGWCRSAIHCSLQCYNNVDCRSFFYKPSGLCLGVPTIVTDPAGCITELGTKYYWATAAQVTTTTTVAPTPVPPTPPVTWFPTAPAFPIYYGAPCSFNTDCLQPNTFCNYYLCECIPGYSLNYPSLTCTDGCTVYGNTYIVYMYQVLNDSNGTFYFDLQPPQCESICESQNCRSFTFNFVYSRCLISHETPLTLPTAYDSHAQLDFYNRNCA